MPSTLSSSTASEAPGPAPAGNRGRVIRYVAAVLILTAVPISLLVRRAVNPVHRVDPLHSGTAPAFELRSVDGKMVSLDGLRGVSAASPRGRPVVVMFWGAWCEQCTNELPRLGELHRRYPQVAIVGILYREDPEVGRATAEKAGVDWPTLVDPDAAAAAAYGVEGAPATFFIRADGTIAGDLLGPVSVGILDKQFEKIAPAPGGASPPGNPPRG